jgi:hypothetical protein
MLKMNFKLNHRNKPFHISTSTKKFPSNNSLQEYWSLYVPSKFMFSCHSARNNPSKRARACHTSERSQSKSECIHRWPARWVRGTIVSSIVGKPLLRLIWHSPAQAPEPQPAHARAAMPPRLQPAATSARRLALSVVATGVIPSQRYFLISQ